MCLVPVRLMLGELAQLLSRWAPHSATTPPPPNCFPQKRRAFRGRCHRKDPGTLGLDAERRHLKNIAGWSRFRGHWGTGVKGLQLFHVGVVLGSCQDVQAPCQIGPKQLGVHPRHRSQSTCLSHHMVVRTASITQLQLMWSSILILTTDVGTPAGMAVHLPRPLENGGEAVKAVLPLELPRPVVQHCQVEH